MNKMNKKGFTLIEMLVVIAIIAVLVSIIVPTVSNATTKAQAATDAANLRAIAASVAIDYMDNNVIDSAPYTMPVSKMDKTQTAVVYLVGNEVKAYFGDNTVDYFAQIAEHGDKTKATASTITHGDEVLVTSAGQPGADKYKPAP